MSKITIVQIADDEGNLRLDRWFKRHYPYTTHAQLQKLLRKGSVRVEGKRAKANTRLEAGQSIRVPPLVDVNRITKPKKNMVNMFLSVNILTLEVLTLAINLVL